MPVDLNRRMPYWPQGYWAGYWPVEYWPVKVIAATFAEPVIGGELGGRASANPAIGGMSGREFVGSVAGGSLGRELAGSPAGGGSW